MKGGLLLLKITNLVLWVNCWVRLQLSKFIPFIRSDVQLNLSISYPASKRKYFWDETFCTLNQQHITATNWNFHTLNEMRNTATAFKVHTLHQKWTTAEFEYFLPCIEEKILLRWNILYAKSTAEYGYKSTFSYPEWEGEYGWIINLCTLSQKGNTSELSLFVPFVKNSLQLNNPSFTLNKNYSTAAFKDFIP